VREVFHEELARIEALLAEMTDLVTTAMTHAAAALSDTDAALADTVIAGDKTIDALRADIEERAITVTARQQPVATDLRVVIASLHIAADLERMGDLAVHVAEAARRLAGVEVPPPLRSTLHDMGQAALRMAAKARQVISKRDVELARELDRDDDAVDALHRQLLRRLVENGEEGLEAAVELTLCGRYYERYADHAVSVGRHMIYLVTGKHPS
jgi:phosphate transport system protein